MQCGFGSTLPVDTSQFEASLDRLLRAHPCEDGELMSYDLMQAFRSLSFTVFNKAPNYSLSSFYDSGSLSSGLSPIFDQRRAIRSNNHNYVENDNSHGGNNNFFNKSRLVLGREALWYAMCIRATQSVENLQTLVYLSAKLLCEEGTRYGEGNEKPYVGDAWILALLSYGLSDRHPELKSKGFYEMERMDRRYLLGHCWLSLGTLRFLTETPNEKTKRNSLHGTAALDASHHCWFKTVSENYPGLMESWFTVLLPKVAEVAEGKGAAGSAGAPVDSTFCLEQEILSSTNAVGTTLSTCDGKSPVPPLISVSASSTLTRPSALMGDANHFIIHSFYYLTSDILAVHRPSQCKTSSSSSTVPRILDREAPQHIWKVVDVLRRALERTCVWLEAEMKYWRGEWKIVQQHSRKKRQGRQRTSTHRIQKDDGNECPSSSSSLQRIRAHGMNGDGEGDDDHRDSGRSDSPFPRATHRTTAFRPQKRVEVLDKTLLDQVRAHIVDALNTMVRKQSELHCLRERVKEQYGDGANDYHYLSERMWEHTLQLCVVIRSLTESTMRALGGLGVFSVGAIAAGRRSAGFVPSTSHLLEYIARCVGMVPPIELEEKEEEGGKEEEIGTYIEGEEVSHESGGDVKRTSMCGAEAKEKVEMEVPGSRRMAFQNPQDAKKADEGKGIKEDWKNFTGELMLLSAASAVAFACPLRDMQQSLWSSNVALTNEVQSLLVHRCLRRGGVHSEENMDGGHPTHRVASSNRISQLAAQLLRSIWSFSLDASSVSGVSGSGAISLHRSGISAASDFVASTSDQLLEMLQSSSFSSNDRASSSMRSFPRDPAALCVIELLSRATLERPHYLIPALFRLLEHGNKDTRRNVLDVLSYLPQLPAGKHSLDSVRENTHTCQETVDEEEEDEEEEEEEETEDSAALRGGIGEKELPHSMRLSRSFVENGTSDAEHHRLMVTRRAKREIVNERERRKRLMSTLAQHLLLHIHDEELCLRMQSANLFSRVFPEDVVEPLVNLCLQTDPTGRRYSSATEALKAVVKVHSHHAQILIDIAECCYAKGEWANVKKKDSSLSPLLHTDKELSYQTGSEKKRNEKSPEDDSNVQKSLENKETKKGDSDAADTFRGMHAAKFQSPGDVLPHALLYSTENTHWLRSSLSSGAKIEMSTSPSTTSSPSVLGKQERLVGLFQLISRHWVSEVRDWSAESHIEPLLAYALSASAADFPKQQFLVKHVLEVLQMVMESTSTSSSPLGMLCPSEESTKCSFSSANRGGTQGAIKAVMHALLPYFECYHETIGEGKEETRAKDWAVDTPNASEDAAATSKTLSLNGIPSQGCKEEEKDKRTPLPAAGVLPSPHFSLSNSVFWESRWLRDWRVCLLEDSGSSPTGPPLPPANLYTVAFPLLCIRRCFSSLGKLFDSFSVSYGGFFSYLSRFGVEVLHHERIRDDRRARGLNSCWVPRRGGLWESLWRVLTHPSYLGCAKLLPEFVGEELEILSQCPPSWFLERWKEDVRSLLFKGNPSTGEGKNMVPVARSTSDGAPCAPPLSSTDMNTSATTTASPSSSTTTATFPLASPLRLAASPPPSVVALASSSSFPPLSTEWRIHMHVDVSGVMFQLLHYYWVYIAFLARLVAQFQRVAFEEDAASLLSSSDFNEDTRMMGIDKTGDNAMGTGRTNMEKLWIEKWLRLPLFVLVHILFPWLEEPDVNAGQEAQSAEKEYYATTGTPASNSILTTIGALANDGSGCNGSGRREECDVPCCVPFPFERIKRGEEFTKIFRRVSLSVCELFAGLMIRRLMDAAPTNIDVLHSAQEKSETTNSHSNRKNSTAHAPIVLEVPDTKEKGKPIRDEEEEMMEKGPAEGKTAQKSKKILERTVSEEPSASLPLPSLDMPSLFALSWVNIVDSAVFQPIQRIGESYRASTAICRACRHVSSSMASSSFPLSSPHLMESFMFACRIHEGFMQHFSLYRAETSIPLIARYMQCLTPLLIETANAAAEWGRHCCSSSSFSCSSSSALSERGIPDAAGDEVAMVQEDNRWVPIAEQCGRLIFQSLMFSSRLPKDIVEKYAVTATGMNDCPGVVQEETSIKKDKERPFPRGDVKSNPNSSSTTLPLSSFEQEERQKKRRKMQLEFQQLFPSFDIRIIKNISRTKDGGISLPARFSSSSLPSSPSLPQTLLELLGEAFFFPIASFALGCLRYETSRSASSLGFFAPTSSVFQDIGIKIFSALLGVAPDMIVLMENGNVMSASMKILRRIAQMHPTAGTRRLAEHVVSLLPDENIKSPPIMAS